MVIVEAPRLETDRALGEEIVRLSPTVVRLLFPSMHLTARAYTLS